MSVITFDNDEIVKLCESAEGFALSAEAEQQLCDLLDVQDKINKFVDETKEKIANKAIESDADFTSISGDKLKLEYRQFGTEYSLQDNATVEEQFVVRSQRMSVNTKAVKEYVAENGHLPFGVVQNERQKTLVIKRKEP